MEFCVKKIKKRDEWNDGKQDKGDERDKGMREKKQDENHFFDFQDFDF
jgi:hypothetical protein